MRVADIGTHTRTLALLAVVEADGAKQDDAVRLWRKGEGLRQVACDNGR